MRNLSCNRSRLSDRRAKTPEIFSLHSCLTKKTIKLWHLINWNQQIHVFKKTKSLDYGHNEQFLSLSILLIKWFVLCSTTYQKMAKNKSQSVFLGAQDDDFTCPVLSTTQNIFSLLSQKKKESRTSAGFRRWNQRIFKQTDQSITKTVQHNQLTAAADSDFFWAIKWHNKKQSVHSKYSKSCNMPSMYRCNNSIHLPPRRAAARCRSSVRQLAASPWLTSRLSEGLPSLPGVWPQVLRLCRTQNVP